jgi:hypothetical protein
LVLIKGATEFCAHQSQWRERAEAA